MNGKITGLLFVLALMTIGLARPAAAQFLTPAPCSSMDLQKATAGVRCTTSARAEFRRYISPASGESGWQDLGEKGLVWYDEVKINSSQSEAATYCAAKPGESVPDLDDFARAGDRGLRELIRGKLGNLRNALLWSSMIDPASHGERAVGFALEAADLHALPVAKRYDNAVVICVGQAAAP